MDIAKRIQLIRIIKKLERNSEFSKRLGIWNKSVFKLVKKQNTREDRL